MRLLVTGKEGQVARSLRQRGSDHDVVLLGRPNFDLAADPATITAAIVDARPDVIVSAAAYTAVDKAESEPDLAFNVNARGAGAVAQAAQALGVPVIHLSTDYVFDGAKGSAYVEDDPTGPTGVYGASKLAGERAVTEACDNSAILRTAWVYSPFGANFVKTMLRLAGDRDELGIVADQFGNPTSALDIADGILQVAANLTASSDSNLRGVFHMTGTGDASWADFAEHIFVASSASGGPTAAVNRIASSGFPTPAKRPANSRLDCSKLEQRHGVRLPRWQDSTTNVIRALVSGSAEGEGA